MVSIGLFEVLLEYAHADQLHLVSIYLWSTKNIHSWLYAIKSDQFDKGRVRLKTILRAWKKGGNWTPWWKEQQGTGKRGKKRLQWEVETREKG